MPDPKVEDVFKTSGVPTYTFVQPEEYTRLLVSLRTPGRGVVVEGPSGIGKTSAVETALRALGVSANITKLTARKRADVEYISALPSLGSVGTVIIDDFHRLDDSTKQSIADYLKTLADESRADVKIVVIGINKAGERLVSFATDLVNRIDIITFENNPDHKVRELVLKGEQALNIRINVADDIASSAHGSFYIAQLLCLEVCLKASVIERQDSQVTTTVSFEAAKASVWDRLALALYDPCRDFCRGAKMKAAGRAPYLNILNLLAMGSGWSLSLREAARSNQTLRNSIGQVIDKKFIDVLLEKNPRLRDLFHYDTSGKRLTVEDPQVVFFLRHMPWARFAREIGFIAVDFRQRYDFALSFAGADRDVAEKLFDYLSDGELEVFYDKNEEYRILAQDVEEYLRPIYQSEATFVVCLLGPEYSRRIWTKFESDAFKDRFKDGAVVPIWFDTAPTGMFDTTRKVGGFDFSRGRAIDDQVARIGDALIKMLEDRRLPVAAADFDAMFDTHDDPPGTRG